MTKKSTTLALRQQVRVCEGACQVASGSLRMVTEARALLSGLIHIAQRSEAKACEDLAEAQEALRLDRAAKRKARK